MQISPLSSLSLLTEARERTYYAAVHEIDNYLNLKIEPYEDSNQMHPTPRSTTL